MDKILKCYYYFIVVVASLGSIFLIEDGEFDVYSGLALIAFFVGLYLIVKKDEKRSVK